MFLNELPPNAVYLLYFAFPSFDKDISSAYPEFDENKLPKYINREELRYEMRRQAVKAHYSLRRGGEVNHHIFRFSITPVAKKLNQAGYEAYKLMGL